MATVAAGPPYNPNEQAYSSSYLNGFRSLSLPSFLRPRTTRPPPRDVLADEANDDDGAVFAGASSRSMAFLVRARPTPWTKGKSFQVAVPFDIWANILAWADYATLQTFTLVSRDLKHEADKHLWQTVTLCAPAQPLYDEFWTRTHIEEGCRVLLRVMDPNRPSGAARASRIRDLTIDIRASLGAEGEEEFERVWKMLVDVLLSARKLRSLTVKGLLHRTRLARSLSSPRTYGRADGINPIAASFAIPISYPSTRSHRSPSHSRRRDGTRSPQTFAPSSTGFPFRLTRFATDLHLDEHLTPFWASQAPSIHSLELLSGDVIQVQTPRVPYPLPTLRTFHASLPVQTTMMRDSPVRAAQLDGMWEGECAMVRENLCGVRKASAKLLAMETEVALNPWTSFDETDDEDDEEGVWMRMRGQPASLPMSGELHLSAAVSGTPSSYQPPSVLSLHPHISHPNPLTSPSTSSLPLSSIPSPALGPAILSLTLTIFDTPCTARVYTSLIAHLPHLRLLTLTHAELRDVAQRRLAMSVLAGLADLEEFEWAAGTASSGGANAAHSTNMIQSASSHTSAQADVFAALANTSSITAAGESAGSGISASAPASVKCRFLRRITFRWGSGNFFVRRFEREVRGSRRSCASGNSASYGASAWGIVQV